MFNLRVVQAYHGDCFIVEYEDSGQTKHMLIDSGPRKIYATHLKPELLRIRDQGGQLDRVVLSHVCNDHIEGLGELYLDLHQQILKPERATIHVKSIWLNQFSQTIGQGEDFSSRLGQVSQQSMDSFSRNIMNEMNYSIARAHGILKVIKPFKTSTNDETKGEIISVENLPRPVVDGNLSIEVIGPDEETIKKLREEWLEWIEKKKKEQDYDNPFFKAMSDSSFQNLSSIVLLLKANRKKMLLTGDARGDFIVKVLRQKNLLSDDKPFYVNILKLPHHGSERNVSEKFFDQVVADVYVISAQKHGRTDNPDRPTLEWIIRSAERRKKKVEIFITNANEAIDKIVQKYGSETNRFRLLVHDKTTDSKVFSLS